MPTLWLVNWWLRVLLGWHGLAAHDLAVLANQLPNSPRWASWKRWLVEHELMMRNDAVACGIVDAQVAQQWTRSGIRQT